MLGTQTGYAIFCADPGEARPPKSSAIITTRAPRGDLARGSDRIAVRSAQRAARHVLYFLSAAAHNRTHYPRVTSVSTVWRPRWMPRYSDAMPAPPPTRRRSALRDHPAGSVQWQWVVRRGREPHVGPAHTARAARRCFPRTRLARDREAIAVSRLRGPPSAPSCRGPTPPPRLLARGA